MRVSFRWFAVAAIASAFVAIPYFVRSHGSDVGRHYPGLTAQDFSAWHPYGGNWSVTDDVLTDRSDGRGDKLVGGPSELGDYVLSADIRFDTAPEDPTFGDAGLLLRVRDSSVGVDALHGYYAALRPDDHVLMIGSMTIAFRELATTPFPHELHPGRWYHLTFRARACNFTFSAEDTVTKEQAEVSYVEQSCDPLRGQVGVRGYYARASWRNLVVSPAP